jgi:hypothetical protein
VALSDAKLVFLSRAWNANDDVRYTEPTPNQWTHVALVSTVGDGVTLYYNGVSQSTGGYYSLNNSSADLAIGKRAPENFQYFDGKLALIRISSTAKYTAEFTPSKTYGVEGDTRLMLGSTTPLVDSHGEHPIDNQGAVISTDFPTIPQTFVALAYTLNHGYSTNYGGNQISVLIADYPTIGDVPNGATVTITGQGSGTFTVTGSYVQSGLRFFTVDSQNFTAWGSDTLTFNWNV